MGRGGRFARRWRLVAAPIALVSLLGSGLIPGLAVSPASAAGCLIPSTSCFVLTVSYPDIESIDSDGSGHFRTDTGQGWDGQIDCYLSGGIVSGSCSYGYALTSRQTSVSVEFELDPDTSSLGCDTQTTSCTSAVFHSSATLTGSTTISRYTFGLLNSVEVKVDGSGPGTVTSDPRGLNASKGVAWYLLGSHLTLTATPDAGATFSGWQDPNCAGQDVTCDLPIVNPVGYNIRPLFVGPATPTPTPTPTKTPTPTPTATTPAPTSAPTPTSGPTATAAPTGHPASSPVAPSVPSVSAAASEATGSSEPSLAASPAAPGTSAGEVSSQEPSPSSTGSGPTGFSTDSSPLLLVLVFVAAIALAGGGFLFGRRGRGSP